jgi:hypothetical protein
MVKKCKVAIDKYTACLFQLASIISEDACDCILRRILEAEPCNKS